MITGFAVLPNILNPHMHVGPQPLEVIIMIIGLRIWLMGSVFFYSGAISFDGDGF